MDFDVVFDVSTLYTLRPPEQNQKKHQTSVQLFHYTLVKSHKYTNSAEGNGNDIKTDTGYYMKIHHHRHHYILIQQKWQIKTRQWRMVSKNGPWLHPGKRCIKATCISAFLFFKQNKNFFSRQRDERQRCRAAGGRSGGFDGGFRSFTHSLCCIWKEGQLVMRKCKDLLKRYVYIIVFCVFCYIWFQIFYFSVFSHLFWKLHCRILSLHTFWNNSSSHFSQATTETVCGYFQYHFLCVWWENISKGNWCGMIDQKVCWGWK